MSVCSRNIKKTHPVNIDFEKIANQLSLEEKEKIFDLAGFDYQKTKKLFTENKTGVYILGVDVLNPDAGAQLAALKFVCDRTKAESAGGGGCINIIPMVDGKQHRRC